MANQSTGENATINWACSAKQSHLPPKSPLFPIVAPALPENPNSLFSIWSNFPYSGSNQKQHQRTPSASVVPNTPSSWIEDLLCDNQEAPPKRSSHRRSSSDSVTFLGHPVNFGRIDEIVVEDELDCRSVASIRSRGSQDFERLDEEQLMSMFSDIEPFQKSQNQSPEASMHGTTGHEKRASTENLPTLSDHSSVNEQSYEDKISGVGKFMSEPEVQSAEHLQQLGKGEILPSTTLIDLSLDPKRAKRILANRQSAQRSRVRKLQYISELERSVNALQAEVSNLSPQVAYLDHQRVILNVDNSALKQRIAALTQDKLFKDAHYEALKEEIHRLRQLFQQQQHKQHQQQDVPFDIQQQQFMKLDLSASLQKERQPDAVDASSDFVKCTSSVTEDAETRNIGHLKSSMPKPIGASCCLAENGRSLEGQMMAGSSSVHPDFIVQNP